MLGRLKFLIFGIVAFFSAGHIAQWLGFDSSKFMCGGTGILALAIVIFFWPAGTEDREYGIEPYISEEEADRANYNEHVRSIAAWSGPNSRYVDYDGWLHDGETHKIIQWVGNNATGKTKRR